MTAPFDPATPIDMTLVLRRRAEPPASAFAGPPLSRAELAERYGADPADVDAVSRAVADAGAQVISADPATRLVKVRGTSAVLARLVGGSLDAVPDDRPGTRAFVGSLALAPALADRVVGVLGLDDRPQAAARFRIARPQATAVSYTPPQLASVYGMPAADGTGQTIAIIELGGGFGRTT